LSHQVVPIPRRHDISLEEFDRDFASLSRPVIISGATADWPAVKWTRQDLRQKCGGRPLILPCGENHVKIRSPSSSREAWGGLQEARLTKSGAPQTIAELMDAQDAGEGYYLHDAPIDLMCPELLTDEIVLATKYFPEDITEQLPLHWLKQDSGHECIPNSDLQGHGHGFPSMFVAGEKTGSKLHVDAKFTRFYMVVLDGQKEWRMFNASDIPALLPDGEKFPTRLGADAFDMDEAKHPELAKTTVFAGTAHKGDIVFVPENWPHQVRNSGPTFAIAVNLVDQYNLQMHMEYIRWEAKSNRAAARELGLYQLPGFPFVERPSGQHRDETFLAYWQRQRWPDSSSSPGTSKHPNVPGTAAPESFWQHFEKPITSVPGSKNDAMLQLHECSDRSEDCEDEAGEGVCARRPMMMQKRCPLSCGACSSGIAPAAKDTDL